MREYWFIVDRPRFKWLPLLRVVTTFKGTCEYYQACEKLSGIKELVPPTWNVSLGRTEPDGSIYVYE